MTATSLAPQDDASAPMADNSQAEDIEKRILIRSYEPRDHAQVIDLFVPGLLSYAKIPGQEPKFWEDYLAKSLQGDLADIHGTYFAPGGHYWVAVIDKDDGSEEIAGMVALEAKDKKNGELRRMSVKAEYRRYGVGRMFVQNLEQWAVQRGFTRVFLAVGYVWNAPIDSTSRLDSSFSKTKCCVRTRCSLRRASRNSSSPLRENSAMISRRQSRTFYLS